MRNKTTSKWNLSRRQFVKGALAFGIMSQIPFAISCSQKTGNEEVLIDIDHETYPLDLKLIQDVQEILFPKDNLGPGAKELKADKYLIWTLNDNRIDPWDNEQLIKGFRRLNSTSKEHHNKKFIQLSKKQQEDLIAQISISDWGQTWLSRMLTIIFEAMYANPNYGSNPEEIGWKWLNHKAGFPQPTKEQIYPEIFQTINQNTES